jgi:hypothetical protein
MFIVACFPGCYVEGPISGVLPTSARILPDNVTVKGCGGMPTRPAVKDTATGSIFVLTG